jgi:GNAT superfamily N-acetyltransferase
MTRPRRLPMVVTFLEMTARPSIPVIVHPREQVAILHAKNPPVHFYRYLYDVIGRAYYWVDRKKVDDETLADIIGASTLELYVLYVEGCPAGMAELDFADPGIAQLAYFGLVPEYVGRGHGLFFLHQAVSLCWSHPIDKVLVNTCTLDHPRALPLYQRAGFVPYAREDRYIELL